jgi:Xaa-Pro aminopeptidase
LVDFELRRAGFERTAFETIVASGPNSALPHARPGSRRLGAGDAVVLDFGGVYKGYCVDLTRTGFIGHPPKSFSRLFNAVADAQAAAIAAVRSGVRASEVDGAARGLLAERGLDRAFGHATGHGLGIDVHEYPRIGRPTREAEDPLLRDGMVVTIEPGVYVPDVGGVRIEDDVLVGPDGAEVLTDIPRGLMTPGAR